VIRGVVRWKAAACGVLGMVLACGGATCAPTDGGGTTAQLIFKGLNAAILSIAGTAANDVYAVGADPDSDDLGPYVLHYNGTNWRRINSGLSGDLWWISVDAIDGAFYVCGEGGLIAKLTLATGAFEAFTTSGAETIYGIWGSSATNLWAVGGDVDDPDTSGVIWHFDGANWTAVDVTSISANGIPILYKVWGRSASEVYAVGRLGYVLRFDGTNWTKPTSGTTRTIFTVHGNSSLTVGTGGAIDGVIVEKNGDSFTNVAAAGTPQLNGVFIPPAGDGVAVGNEAAVARRTNGTWAVDADITFDTTRDFHATWGDPDGGIWAVGGDLSVELADGIVAYIGGQTISTEVAP